MAKHYLFGTGNLYYTPVGGGAPQVFGAIQDVQVSLSGDTKALYGASSFPLDTARGKTKIEGKASFGQLDANLFNSIFFGLAATTGETLYVFNEAGTVPTTPFQITVANGATFKTDLGVFNAATGTQLTQVASGPTTGQYAVNSVTGVYTFAAADVATTVVISYTYTSAATGKTITVTNTLMGSIPTFQLILANKTKTKTSVMTLLCCTSNKLTFPFKQDDYMINGLDFQAQDNGSGSVMTWSMTGG